MNKGELQLKNGRAWFGACPERYSFTPVGFTETHIEAIKSGLSEENSLCLRLLFQTGIISYGVLGCRFVPTATGPVVVRVYHSGKDTYILGSGAILPEEYARTVLARSIKVLGQHNFFGPGKLIFDHADFHLIDSNRWIFGLLTSTLLWLLRPEHQFVSEQTINDRITETRHNPNL